LNLVDTEQVFIKDTLVHGPALLVQLAVFRLIVVIATGAKFSLNFSSAHI